LASKPTGRFSHAGFTSFLVSRHERKWGFRGEAPKIIRCGYLCDSVRFENIPGKVIVNLVFFNTSGVAKVSVLPTMDVTMDTGI